MIKKLKKQFIFIHMVLVGIVVVISFSVLCLKSFDTYTSDIWRSLAQAVDMKKNDTAPDSSNNSNNGGNGSNSSNNSNDGGNGNGSSNGSNSSNSSNGSNSSNLPEIGGRPSDDGERKKRNMSNVVVTADNDGNITDISENHATIVSDILEEGVNEVVNASKDSGILYGLGLMYLKRITPDGTIIAFAGTSQLEANMQNIIVMSLVICTGIIVVLFFISRILAELTVRPVEQSWKQQKQFVADASHELKTPLTVILANNNILMSHREAQVDSQRQWIESTQEEALRMKQMVEQLLFLAKSDAEQVPVVLETVDMGEVLEGCLLHFEPIAYEKGVELESSIQEGLMAKSQSAMLSQLIQILLDNGIKYSSGQAPVKVSLVREGKKILLRVRSYGEVISPEDLPHIFDRFYRGDKAHSEGGYGLGLAIAQNIVTVLQGKISAASSEAEGTIFCVEFTLLA